jgi:hypothetical protein
MRIKGNPRSALSCVIIGRPRASGGMACALTPAYVVQESDVSLVIGDKVHVSTSVHPSRR